MMLTFQLLKNRQYLLEDLNEPASKFVARTILSEQSTSKYPVSEHFKVLDGYDIYHSNNLIIALVAVEANNRKDLRLYRWQNRQGNWKVDLCRMSVTRWH